ncbi:ABC transporter substrate-binding protein [Sphingosinicella sp. CPCC 101087]|uniref:ABC transporter substrate-binding protein n=1 Tax=Sphingosinicella sp. CPCC 101087 TaxID=2497754 RepID=UPI00101C52C2|nr:ABC transporter substrate-binding protein [Sphingosinicella sp. CPCC 101087]
MTMPFRCLVPFALFASAFALSGCEERATGPLRVSAIGAPPEMVNPNLQPMDAASAFLLEATAQGLVRLDASGEVEPALAQSWIVSDDGLRYTFRIRQATWADGSRVTAEQVTARLLAAASRASRNPLKPVLGAIAEVEAMTDQVLEISLQGPRPNLLHLLAQPEFAIMVDGGGTGPYRVAEAEDGVVRLVAIQGEEEEETVRLSEILLRGEAAATAVARFVQGEADLVTGGTIGTLPLPRAAGADGGQLQFDPAAGLLGLEFRSAEGPLADPAVRAAMSMAVDRESLVSALAVPTLQPITSILPPITGDAPRPVLPVWALSSMPMRRELAARTIAALEARPRIRVAMPDEPGYRLLFAHLRRDWRLIGIEAERVGPDETAELRLVDAVAPARLSSWYFRRFTCEAGPVCDAEADAALEAARMAPTTAQRRMQLNLAERVLTGLTPYIPLTTPVRWSLVAPRLTGFRPNPFAHHPAGTLIAQEF